MTNSVPAATMAIRTQQLVQLIWSTLWQMAGKKALRMYRDTKAEKIDELVERADEMLGKCKVAVDSGTKKLCGYSLHEQFEDASDALIALYQDTDKGLCRLAIIALSAKWKVDADSQHATRIKQIAMAGRDSGLRESAILALGSIYQGKDHDGKVGRILASIVLDKSAQKRLREAAYYGLEALIESHHLRMPENE